MALGRPSIIAPQQLSLQALQQVVNNIRERITAIDVALNRAQGGATQVLQGGSTDVTALRRLLESLTLRIAALEAAEPDLSEAADDLVLQSGEALATGAPVWLSAEGIVSQIDPDDPLASSGFAGISTQTVTSGEPVLVRRFGIVEVPGETLSLIHI